MEWAGRAKPAAEPSRTVSGEETEELEARATAGKKVKGIRPHTDFPPMTRVETPL